MNKNYTNRELSELFDKIDTLLQRYFGKEDDYTTIANCISKYLKSDFEGRKELLKEYN